MLQICNAHAPLQVLFVHLGNGTDELYFSPHKKKILGSSAGLCETAIVLPKICIKQL